MEILKELFTFFSKRYSGVWEALFVYTKFIGGTKKGFSLASFADSSSSIIGRNDMSNIFMMRDKKSRLTGLLVIGGTGSLLIKQLRMDPVSTGHKS